MTAERLEACRSVLVRLMAGVLVVLPLAGGIAAAVDEPSPSAESAESADDVDGPQEGGMSGDSGPDEGATDEESPPTEHPFPSPDPEPFRVDGTLRLQIADPGVITLADGRRFFDTLELRPDGQRGLLINDLSMDDYIAGLAEMPTRWPIEALKAQAVAARTYAWRALRADRYPGYDICATVDCQVFRGAGVVLDSATGDRWLQAVRETSGEVLLDGEGLPILARYFSTSGGRTYANEEVFPSSGSFPYLQAIDDPYDAASPLHRWTATFTRAQLEAIFANGATLSNALPLATLERLGDVADPQARIRVTSTAGQVAEVGAVAFRDFVSQQAASMFPDEFPGRTDDGEGALPTAMPSSRFDIRIDGEQVVFDGQGWGHGVGMGQYGAYARAEEGATYREILAAYYGGLEPTSADALPDRIRVGMSVSLPTTFLGDDAFSVAAGDFALDLTMGTWTVDRVEGSWQLTPPRGHDQTLQSTPTRLVGEGMATADAATVEVAVNKPVALRMRVEDASRQTVLERYLGVADHGVHAFTWYLDDEQGQQVAPGTYLVTLSGTDLDGATFGTPVPVEVPEPPPLPTPEVVDEPERREPRSWPEIDPWILIGLAGLVLLGGALLFKDRS